MEKAGLSYRRLGTALVLVTLALHIPMQYLLYSHPVSIQSEENQHTNTHDLGGALHQVFTDRRCHLQERCLQLNVTQKYPVMPWVTFLTQKSPGPLEVCVPFKVASTSWRELNKRLNNHTYVNLRPASAILVRHPLSRLASGYRDRFLDGRPINPSSAFWRKRSGPEAVWTYYWFRYWLPALITSGKLTPSWEFTEMLRENREIFEFVRENHVLRDRMVMITKRNTLTEIEAPVGIEMTAVGRQVGLREAAAFAYGNATDQLEARFGNVSFSFVDFLEFVVWTNERGVLDAHWSPYAELCTPCLKDYDYILHLETIASESKVLLKDVGYPEEMQLKIEHETKGRALSGLYSSYFRGVPKSLMEKIISIYEIDFDLFGYDKFAFK